MLAHTSQLMRFSRCHYKLGNLTDSKPYLHDLWQQELPSNFFSQRGKEINWDATEETRTIHFSKLPSLSSKGSLKGSYWSRWTLHVMDSTLTSSTGDSRSVVGFFALYVDSGTNCQNVHLSSLTKTILIIFVYFFFTSSYTIPSTSTSLPMCFTATSEN